MYFEYFFYISIILIFFIFLNKKLKKYIKIYNKNGFDGLWFYFYNKNIRKTGFNNFIDKKKNIIGKKIERLSKNKILYGSYSGTKITSSFEWSKTDLSAKYLGTYESQVQEKIILLSKKFKLKNLIDLGAAEGYHIVSLLNKGFFSKGIAYEINQKSREYLKKNATANNLLKKLVIYKEATFETLKKNLGEINQRKTLFLIDIEGNEFYLFNDKFCNFFSKCFFIIECHEFNIKNKRIIKNFYNSIKKRFKIEIIKDISKDPFNFDILNNFSDDEKYLMMSEGRPKKMQWVVLYPKY